jgi:hypothetical protein
VKTYRSPEPVEFSARHFGRIISEATYSPRGTTGTSRFADNDVIERQDEEDAQKALA